VVQLLTVNSEFESAKTLGFPTFVEPDEIDKNDLVIRWGQGDKYGPDFKHILNRGKCISFNVRKFSALKELAKVVTVPKIFPNYVPTGILAVIRPWQHAGGEDFNIQKGPYEIPYGYYGAEWIETDTEYRVWFCCGKLLCAERLRSADKSVYPNRAEWGYGFVDVPHLLRKLVAKATKQIGLDIGAADILFKDSVYYFLELNSAPSIDHRYLREWFQSVIPKTPKDIVREKVEKSRYRLCPGCEAELTGLDDEGDPCKDCKRKLSCHRCGWPDNQES